MARRSLRASSTGIKQAKIALDCQNLTQKALAEEHQLASWSTINKFFTGKPVERRIFIDICNTLDLEWEDIAIPPQPPEPPPQANIPNPSIEPTHLLSALQQQANAARLALNPRILERIPRPIVEQKYIPAIHRGVLENKQRLIPLIGAAGYGKSTLLGDIYDHLNQTNTPWVALILCNSLVLDSPCSPSTLSLALGETACGIPIPITEIASILTPHYGRGVLLIDTLDLVLNRPFVSALNSIFPCLLHHHTTIVFTCRDHEYNDFLEPTRIKLAPICESIDRYHIPEFTLSEVKAAATAFVSQQGRHLADRGRTFTERLLTLSAHARSIQEITRNPLLLALLCDLFAQEGNVPPDLTVSKLYQRYWQEKIAYSRIDDSHSSVLAITKEQFCLTLAQALFQMSTAKLCESTYRDELGIQFTAPLATAYDDLLSEGVLELLPSGKIHFFHQTLLEYAIAYWLTRHSAQPQRHQLLQSLNASDTSSTPTHWWPIIRQLLTIVETEAEFEQIQNQLDTRDVAAFGTLAFAAASRNRPDALLNLLPTALELGEAYQKRLRLALESAPRQLALELWSAMLTLLQQGGHTTAVNTAKSISGLLARWPDILLSRLDEALNAIAHRTATNVISDRSITDDRSLIGGWLLQQCFPILKQQVNLDALAALRKHYPLLGANSAGEVLALHLAEGVPRDAQHALLDTLLQAPLGRSKTLQDEITHFWYQYLCQSQPTSPESESITRLQEDYPQGWDVVVSLTIGRWAADNPTILRAIVDQLIQGDDNYLRRYLISITAAIRQGAGSWVIAALTQTRLDTLETKRFNSIVGLLKDTASTFNPRDQDVLTQWLEPLIFQQPTRWLPVLDALANGSAQAQALLPQLIEQLPPSQRQKEQVRLLRFLPIDQHPPITDLDKASQSFLVKLYRQSPPISPLALNQLLAAAVGRFKTVALAASADLDEWAGEHLSVTQLLPLLRATVPGVRVNALQAISHLTQNGSLLTEAELTAICSQLNQETNQAVVRPLCEIVATWVQTSGRVPPAVPATIGQIPPRLVERDTFEGGTAKVTIAALKAIAQTEATTLHPQQLGEWVRQLLMAIDIIRVEHSESEVIDLLSAVDRLSKDVLPQMVTEDCPHLAQRGWTRNLAAIIKTIKRVETHQSTLLDQILACDWCTPDITSVILEIKGA